MPGDPGDPIGPRWLHELGRDFTALGVVAFFTLLTLAVIGFLMLQRRFSAAVLVAALLILRTFWIFLFEYSTMRAL